MTITASPQPDQARARPAGRRRISVLGATGSVGSSTLDLVAREPERYEVVALTAARNVAALADAALAMRAEIAVVADPAGKAELEERLAGSGIAVAAGPEAVVEAAERPTDLVVSAIVGAAGLAPSLAALAATGVLALANKETLVTAGACFMAEAARRGCHHPAGGQRAQRHLPGLGDGPDAGDRRDHPHRLGWPFPDAAGRGVRHDHAGDGAEAPELDDGAQDHHRFGDLDEQGARADRSESSVPRRPRASLRPRHPQSVIHGLVRYSDGSVLAELGSPDMRTPIGYCLAWPERRPTPVKPLDLAALGTVTFEAPDRTRFPCLPLAEAAMRRGSGAPCVLNAANEIAVEAFLGEAIGFTRIAEVIEETLSWAERTGMMAEPSSLAEALALDGAARATARALV